MSSASERERDVALREAEEFRAKERHQKAQRVRVLLADGLTAKAVARAVGLNEKTVRRIRDGAARWTGEP